MYYCLLFSCQKDNYKCSFSVCQGSCDPVLTYHTALLESLTICKKKKGYGFTLIKLYLKVRRGARFDLRAIICPPLV